ncbi:MAG: branched-chain amino acid transport system substrate-binding protein [Thermoleophilaceae bacterium]|nr:branched-chain amino acid transport system substrate-binding protein [Thermoleophilaceae bacterium]
MRSLNLRFGLAAVLVLAMAVATACGKGGGSNAESGVQDGKLKLGAALSLTGSLAKEGALTKQGYQLCQEKVNARGGVKVGDQKANLSIAYSDDKSEPDTAARLVDTFNDDGVKLLLGPYGSPSTEAAAAAVERNGQVMVDSSGADDNIFTKGYRNTFAVLSPASKYVAIIVDAIVNGANPKPKTVAFLSADDGFSQTAAKGGVAEAEKQGLQVVAQESFPEHTTDVSSALTKVRGKNPDLILGSVHVEEGIAIVKQSTELGVKPQGFGETVAPPTPDFSKALGDAANGVVGSTQWTSQAKGRDEIFGTAQDYAADFKKRFDADAEYHSAEGAAACLALVLAVEKAGSADSAKVRDALAGLDTESFFGPIKFDDTGKNVTKPMSAIQIQNGKVVTIYPEEQAEAKLQWPGTGG